MMEITIDRLKGIALDIKLDAANDLGLDNALSWNR
jgi:hypothetical protein